MPALGGSAAAAVATAGVVVALDQATKQLANSNVARGESVKVFPGLEISNTRNTGVAFGVFEGGGLIVGVLIGVALVLLIGYFLRHSEVPCRWGCFWAVRSATWPIAPATGPSSISSTLSRGRRSTWPTPSLSWGSSCCSGSSRGARDE